MEFAAPWLLASAILAIPVLLVARRRPGRGYVLPSGGALAAAPKSWRIRLLPFLPLLRAAAVVLLAVAVAGPRVGDANAVVRAEGIDIALSFDLSSSMTAAMGETTRLEATKDVIRAFIRERDDDRIGVVVFQRDALALSPPTLDYEALDKLIEDLRSGILPDGTGIGVGLGEAVNMLRESTAASRVVVLLTDGQHNATSLPPEQAAELAQALNIRVYTIGVVTNARNPGGEVDEALMKRIAEETGGKYFVADTQESLQEVYDEIGRLEKSAVGRDRFQRFDELAFWFLVPAGALLLLDLVLRATWLRRNPA
ncbi:MAG: VWA domain-containing protein [Dehalococcoidia bacterium]